MQRSLVLALVMLTATVSAQEARVPVVIELFTSEGCSSCPSADAALRTLDLEQPVEGVELLALGFHVDYWDYLGWKDPFSTASATERQYAYSRAFGRDGAYTPQLVVNGRVGFVGEKQRAIAEAVRAAKLPRAEVKLREAGDGKLELSWANLVETRDAELFVALTEHGLSTRVKRGENAGRVLEHAPVVRAWIRVASAGTASGTATASLHLSKAWKRENLRAVAILQSKSTRQIHGAGATTLRR